MTDEFSYALSEEQILTLAASHAPVLEHTVRWKPRTWAPYINSFVVDDESRATAEALISTLCELAELANSTIDSDRADMSRMDVVERFREHSPWSGFVAAIVWGCGTRHRSRMRMLRVFFRNETTAERIERFVRVAGEANPLTAWMLICNSPDRLKHLGVAFGTKITYFAALSHTDRDLTDLPLIADMNVAAALQVPVDSAREPRWYIEYCAFAEQLAKRLPQNRRRPDQIELALFRQGQVARAGRPVAVRA